jgi:hypothetical protein
MNDEEYLWDRSGEPTPELAHLERALGKMAWSGRQPELPSCRVPRNWWTGHRPWLIAAAALLTVAASGVFLAQKVRHAQPVTSWQLSLAGGNPSAVRSRQVIETNRGNALLESESIGEVQIDPNSRLRLLASGHGQHRLALDHGTLHA